MISQEHLLSISLKKISFLVFDLIKKGLPDDYLITLEDINFLLCIDYLIDREMAKELGFGEYILMLFERNPEYLKKHCDPYELFIDSGFLDNKLNAIGNEG